MMRSTTTLDFEDQTLAYGAIAGSLFVLVGYHIRMYVATLSGKGRTTQLSQNIRNSSRWVLKHRQKGDSVSCTLAIQTFRNTIMVAVFVGGNAFVQAFTFADGYQSSVGNPIEQARYIVLAGLLFGSFLSWACVIRFVSHLGYIIGTMSHDPPSTVGTMQSIAIDTKGEAPTESSIATGTGSIPPQTCAKNADDHHTRIVKECVRIMSINMIFFR